MYDLSVLIPSRCEIFLSRTIQDVLDNMRGNTEVIAVLDGSWSDPPIPDHPDVTLIYNAEAVGQRAAINQAARMSEAKYVMKLDAHCSVAEGFDVAMLEVMQDNWTAVPVMKNLHAFDVVCNDCGRRAYQGPLRCSNCKSENVYMDVIWKAKPSPNSTSYCFDSTLHFKYFGEYKKRPEAQGDITETMSLQGSCWMLSRDKFFELNICDETWGSWGNMGTEVACKTWLSGGKVMVNHKTWHSHLFRTQTGFSFPYPQSGSQVERARQKSRDIFLNNQYEKQIYPLSWLLEKFWPVPGWTEEDLARLKTITLSKPNLSDDNITNTTPSKGIVYYTDNRLDEKIMSACQQQLYKATGGGIMIVSVSLKPVNFGKNIVLPLEPSYLAMFMQILAGLEAIDTDIVFFCEHDVLYHPTHFDFTPPDKEIIYFNINVWKLRIEDGHCLHYDCQQTSGLCAYRDTLIKHYRQRVINTEAKLSQLGDTREYRNWIRRQGFEPGACGRAERVDDLTNESWVSPYPNVDIRHSGNLTSNRWRRDQFRNERSCRNWIEDDSVPGWGLGLDISAGARGD